MSRLNEDQIDAVSTKHVRKNSKFLKDFFEHIYIGNTSRMLENPVIMRHFCQAINKFKDSCNRIFNKQREVRYPVNVRKTVINPSYSALPGSPANPLESSQESSTYFTPSTSPQKSAFTSSSPRHDSKQKSPRTPERPQNAEPFQKPVAPDRQHFVRPKLVARESKRFLYIPPWFNDGKSPKSPEKHVPQEGAGSGITTTPKRNLISSKPHSPKVVNTFRVTIQSTDVSGVKTIEGDTNISSSDITKVNEIMENISQRAGADLTTNNVVMMSTKNSKIVPGKYKMYKVNRLRL